MRGGAARLSLTSHDDDEEEEGLISLVGAWMEVGGGWEVVVGMGWRE